MTKKELVEAMGAQALENYFESNIQEYHIAAFKTVILSLAKHQLLINELKDDIEADWDKVIYQLVFDQQFEWATSRGYSEQARIGHKCMTEDYVKLANGEGYEFQNITMQPEKYFEEVEKYGLVATTMSMRVILEYTEQGIVIDVEGL